MTNQLMVQNFQLAIKTINGLSVQQQDMLWVDDGIPE